jgi:hypothetical protein
VKTRLQMHQTMVEKVDDEPGAMDKKIEHILFFEWPKLKPADDSRGAALVANSLRRSRSDPADSGSSKRGMWASGRRLQWTALGTGARAPADSLGDGTEAAGWILDGTSEIGVHVDRSWMAAGGGGAADSGRCTSVGGGRHDERSCTVVSGGRDAGRTVEGGAQRPTEGGAV